MYYCLPLLILTVSHISRSEVSSDFLAKTKQQLLGAMQMTEEDVQKFNSEDYDREPQLSDELILTGVPNDNSEVEFAFDSEYGQRSVESAKLHFYSKPSRRILVQIHEVDEETGEKTLIANKTIKTSRKTKKHTVEVDSYAAQRWINDESVILAFTVKNEDNSILSDSRPVQLDLELSKRSSRNRRHLTNICPDDSDKNECCLSKVKLNFQELGLPNVIAPKEADIHLCNGKCEKDESFMQLFTGISRRVFRNEKIHGPACCHATEWKGVDIVFINTTNQHEHLHIHQLDAVSCLCS